MNRIFIIMAISLMACVFSNKASANNERNDSDSIARAVRMKSLETRRDKLQKEIKIQDARRNKHIAGVSVETLEEMNDRQDSICLALRSELVDVILEIKEIAPDVASPAIIQQYNHLVNKREQPDSNRTQPEAVQSGRQPSNLHHKN